MKIPSSRGIVCKECFQIQALFLVLTFQMMYVHAPYNMVQPLKY